MLDATLAIHSQRKMVCRSGLQVERVSGGGKELYPAPQGRRHKAWGFSPRWGG